MQCIKLLRPLIICAVLAAMVSCKVQTHNYIPKEGYVPDEQTAIAIAEAIWLPIYGEDELKEKPYKASLTEEGVWIVKGNSEPIKTEEGITTIKFGGVAYIEIRKEDCKILKVSHGK